LDQAFTHRQWPRFTDYTKRFHFAVGYVFIKQSDLSCHCDLLSSEEAAGIPSRELTGPICRIPWAGLSQTPLPTQQRHLCRFSVRSLRNLLIHIFMGSRNRPKPAYAGLIAYSLSSPHDETPSDSMLNHSDGYGRAILNRLCMMHWFLSGTGILTGFPFPHPG